MPASAAASFASSTATGSGGSCFTPGCAGFTRIWPLTSGTNSLTTSRMADGKTLTPRTISMSSVRPMQRTRGAVRPHRQGEVQTSTWSRVRKRSKRCGLVLKMREHELALGAVLHRERRAALGIDQFGMDEAAAAEMHALLLLAFAPERDADVADAHGLGDPRAPAFLQPCAQRRFAAAGLAGDQHALDA